MADSETPMTDDEIDEIGFCYPDDGVCGLAEMRDFARQLKRELAAAQQRAKHWEEKFQRQCEQTDEQTMQRMQADRRVEELEAEQEIERLREEVEYLRRFGNKDCTAMADEALDAARKADK